jgi:putative hydrolases of HD superfamily
MELTVATNLLKMFAALMSLRRWNLIPRVETWMEAENIAHYTLLSWAIATESDGLDSDEVKQHLLLRCLLKSLNKHTLADTSIKARDALRRIAPEVWRNLVDAAAEETLTALPEAVVPLLKPYLVYTPAFDHPHRDMIEDLIVFCQYKVAEDELVPGMRVFPDSEPAHAARRDLQRKSADHHLKGPHVSKFEIVFNDLDHFRSSIRNLKYVMRWNRTSRVNEATVLGHTFMVSVLAAVYSMLGERQYAAQGIQVEPGFVHKCIARAMFHDVPESFTGDIITPVKEKIKAQNPDAWEAVEQSLADEFLTLLPARARAQLDPAILGGPRLLADFSPQPRSVDSLVKTCDQLALVMECKFEKDSGSESAEIRRAEDRYLEKLAESEWLAVREYARSIL